MKNVTNYLKLIILLATTIFLTLFLASQYKSNDESELYLFANKITESEFTEFLIENPDAIIYLSTKNNPKYKNFEVGFKENIEKYNLKDKFVFIDNKNLTNSFYNDLGERYSKSLNKCKGPMVLLILDSKLSNYYCINSDIDADNFIDYKVFE